MNAIDAKEYINILAVTKNRSIERHYMHLNFKISGVLRCSLQFPDNMNPMSRYFERKKGKKKKKNKKRKTVALIFFVKLLH